MININKTKNVKSDYPVVEAGNFLSNKICKNIRKEIIRFGNFDDFVMRGRNRINKGSKNFKKFMDSSEYSRKLYNNRK